MAVKAASSDVASPPRLVSCNCCGPAVIGGVTRVRVFMSLRKAGINTEDTEKKWRVASEGRNDRLARVGAGHVRTSGFLERSRGDTLQSSRFTYQVNKYRKRRGENEKRRRLCAYAAVAKWPALTK